MTYICLKEALGDWKPPLGGGLERLNFTFYDVKPYVLALFLIYFC